MRVGKSLLALLAFLVGLLLCEGLVAMLYPQLFVRPKVWQFDSKLGWAHIPNATGHLIKPEFDVEYTISSAGLRDREYTREKPQGIRRLLLFGDSFAEGWGVEMAETVGRRLELALNSNQTDPIFQVLNFGVAGFGTDQELLYFDEVGRHYDPDHLLVLFYPNDLLNNVSQRGIGAERGFKPQFTLDRPGRLKLRGVPVPRSAYWSDGGGADLPWSATLMRYLTGNWHLAALVNKSMSPPLPRGQSQMFYDALYGTKPDSRTVRMWHLSAKVLEVFRARALEAGAEMHLVYVPAIVQIEDEDWRRKRDLHGLIGEFDLKKPNREIAKIAERYDVQLVDLYPGFKGSGDKLYYDESHWNRSGHGLAAELIADHLRNSPKFHVQGP